MRANEAAKTVFGGKALQEMYIYLRQINRPRQVNSWNMACEKKLTIGFYFVSEAVCECFGRGDISSDTIGERWYISGHG